MSGGLRFIPLSFKWKKKFQPQGRVTVVELLLSLAGA